MSTVTRAAKAAKDVAEFNEQHPVGTHVRYWTGVREGEGHLGTTWTEAQLMSGYGVVYVRNDRGQNVGSVSLTHVEPVDGAVIATELEQRRADRVTSATSATAAIELNVQNAMAKIEAAFIPQRTNEHNIFSDPTTLKTAVREAAAELVKAIAVFAETEWPSESDYAAKSEVGKA